MSIWRGFSDEKGMVLVVSLLLIVVLVLLGTTAVMTSTTDIRISSNYKTSNQAFYCAEAGIEEARARLKADADPAIRITDSQPTDPNWCIYIGKGYDSDQHDLYPSLQSTLDYTVKIQHRTDASNQVLYWGDANGDGINERNTTKGQNIYLVTSHGSASGANKTIEVEMTRLPSIATPAALYVEAQTTIQGTSTILGNDKPGIVTTLGSGSITQKGKPKIKGKPDILYNGTDMDIQAMIDDLKDSANFKYNISTFSTYTGDQGWGSPTGADQDKPSSCSLHNIIHYNTNKTGIRLTGGVSGCGILLVEGNLEVDGNFSWYGVVVSSGSVIYTGGGNITGAVLAGGSVDVGDNANIVYCSSAVEDQTKNCPLRILSWREKT